MFAVTIKRVSVCAFILYAYVRVCGYILFACAAVFDICFKFDHHLTANEKKAFFLYKKYYTHACAYSVGICLRAYQRMD